MKSYIVDKKCANIVHQISEQGDKTIDIFPIPIYALIDNIKMTINKGVEERERGHMGDMVRIVLESYQND